METKKSFKQKFRNFKEGRMGRTVDITLGSLLLFYTILYEPYRIIALIIGILAFTAGVFNICWAAPFIGVPFRGSKRDIPNILKILLLFITIIWLIGAYKAGTFIYNKNQYATGKSLESIENFSKSKKFIKVNDAEVAYIEAGSGEVVILIHGCPFQSFEWSKVIPILSKHYKILAPDLLGLGDTRVKLNADYSLQEEMKMIVGFMNKFGIKSANLVGHDQGGAIVQMMMKYYPDRIKSAVLTNAEAYDNWPSSEENIYVKLIANPISSPFMRLALGSTFIQKDIFSIAVASKKTLSKDVLYAFSRQHIQTPKRWFRFRRYYKTQLDENNIAETMKALDGMKRFNKPTLLVWGVNDKNFGMKTAERLANDIPGYIRTVRMEKSAHLPMLEEPGVYARSLLDFWKEIEKKKDVQ